MAADLDRLRQRLAGEPSLRRTHRLLLDPTMAQWPCAKAIALDVEANRETAAAWLPAGLVGTGRARIFVASYPASAIGIAYQEAAILLHARHRGRPVLHCAWIVVDDDAALILGRELLGFPKKMATIDLTWVEGRAEARVTRRGTTLIAIDLPLDIGPAPTTDGMLGVPIVNVWGLPGMPAALLSMDVPERVREARRGAARLTVRGSICDPLDALGIGPQTVAARSILTDLATPPPNATGKFLPPGLRPVGLASPTWLARQLPLRSL